MTPVLVFAIVFALGCFGLSMLLALWRMLYGPSAQDRVLAIDYLYLNGMLAMLALGIRYASSMYFEAALMIAVAGFVSTAALAKFLLRGGH